MDVLMPQMDGPTTCRMIRSVLDVRARKMPIIGLTASTHPKDSQRCFDAGMDDVIIKPLEPKHLIQVISTELQRTKLADSDDERNKATA